MKLNHLSFQQLFRLQSSTNIMRFLDGSHDSALAICQSRIVRRAMILAARREFVRLKQLDDGPIRYSQVYRYALCSAGELADRHMVCRANLIREHLEGLGLHIHSLREFDQDKPFQHRVEVWILGSPVLCRAITFQLGMYKNHFLYHCQRALCDPTILCPYISPMRFDERINPANTFSATPDAMDIWKTFCEYAN